MRKVFAVLFVLVGCHRDPAFLKLDYEVVDKTRTYRNPMVPEELRKEILKDNGNTVPKKDHSEGKKAEEHGDKTPKAEKETKAESHEKDPTKAPGLVPLPGAEFDRLPLKVYLHERNRGVLKDRNLMLDFNAGGGEVDLAEFLNPQRRGTFYFAVKPAFEAEGTYEVYFLSNGRERVVGGEKIGGGCGSFFNVTSHFSKAMKNLGLAINTTEQRHVSALAGTYFFVYRQSSGRVALSYLDVTDSRFKPLLCR